MIMKASKPPNPASEPAPVPARLTPFVDFVAGDEVDEEVEPDEVVGALVVPAVDPGVVVVTDPVDEGVDVDSVFEDVDDPVEELADLEDDELTSPPVMWNWGEY